MPLAIVNKNRIPCRQPSRIKYLLTILQHSEWVLLTQVLAPVLMISNHAEVGDGTPVRCQLDQVDVHSIDDDGDWI